MKQGTNFILPVSIDYDLSLVEKVEFIFQQRNIGFYNTRCLEHDDASIMFEYPSSVAVAQEGANVINLYWSAEDTYLFNPCEIIYMDTRIHIKDSDQNPETRITKLRMQPTLFLQ